jgi:hypothetical protein
MSRNQERPPSRDGGTLKIVDLNLSGLYPESKGTALVIGAYAFLLRRVPNFIVKTGADMYVRTPYLVTDTVAIPAFLDAFILVHSLSLSNQQLKSYSGNIMLLPDCHRNATALSFAWNIFKANCES